MKESYNDKGRRKLGNHEISLRWYSSKNTQICLNQYLSELVAKSKLSKCFISIDTAYNRLFLVFGSLEGMNFRYTGIQKKVLTITSWKIAGKILKFFSIDTPSTYRLHVSQNLSKTDSCITIQIMKYYKLSDLQGDKLINFYETVNLKEPEEIPEEAERLKKTNKVSTLNEKDCIKFLKARGYKIMKQVVEYVEV